MAVLYKLNNYLDEMDSYIDSYTIEKPTISKASVGWHLDHNLKVINNVVMALQASNPENYKDNLRFLGKVFLTLGYFPRGKAKAPKYVKPPEVIIKEDLITQIELARVNIKTISNLDEKAFFKHPLFGNINRNRVSRFLETHTNHHLKIIRDVLK